MADSYTLLNDNGTLELHQFGKTVRIDFIKEPTIVKTVQDSDGGGKQVSEASYSEVIGGSPGSFLTATWLGDGNYPGGWDVDHFAGFQRWSGYMSSQKLYRGIRRAGFDEDAIDACKKVVDRSYKIAKSYQGKAGL